ncbi:hypothetical protein PC9H_002026 [Pleurotus ostreatus]|uniref:PHD-type domain-containing protein n=1 Tax=Pleurotus ostreatus TaxID=5322 RepID=A0A8H7DQ28_PLEOS|nr:uncharacterized protein PC9H_002026 [Pleurotus ostreatus]KAF7419436.1 hypothetical protein PC9H_002026 [Pleurotus ostreatus]KAJ8689762.1 SET domain-containing protein 3 [Pleurotus ostreatus]
MNTVEGMNDAAAEAALGLLGLSPTNLQPPSPIVPSKRKHNDPLQSQVAISSHQTQSELPDEGIDCICAFSYDDGFSIQCDDCQRWVHAACYGIVDPGEVKACEWRCSVCVPREVDKEAAKRIQLEKQKVLRVGNGNNKPKPRKPSPVGDRKGGARRPSAVTNAVDGHTHGGKRKPRRPSIINPSTSHGSHVDEEHVDVGDSWMQSYVPITHDIINHPETREKLQQHAQRWRGVTAISPGQETLTTVRPVHVPHSPYSNPSVRPPSFALHTTAPIPNDQLIAPYPSLITPSAAYLSDPLNAYAHLGIPKPFVHLIGHPLDVALDSRWRGDKSRFARNGCRPNAVLRPMLCSRSPDTKAQDDALSFGVFALRDLKANEEVVLGWEWDDGNAIHNLPAAIQTPHLFRDINREHDSAEQLDYLRRQMSIIIHTLSSTFTTCACGAKAKDCAIAQAAAFVDGYSAYSPGPGTSKPIDLGPLVGVERGFRTREKVPLSGGIGGVEMCPEVAPEIMTMSAKRKGKAKATEGMVLDVEMEEASYGAGAHSDIRGVGLSSPLRNIKRLPRKRTATDSIPAPPIPPLLPPRPPEIPSASPRSDSMDIDGEENEEKMPPKMRKRWIHKNLDALKEISRRDVSPESPSQSITAQPAEEVAMDMSEGCSDGQSRVIQAPLLNRMSIDTLVHPRATDMPPPPMPAALDPTTITSIPPTRQTLSSFDFASPAAPANSNPVSTSPTTSFAKLSLLSPVVIHRSPPMDSTTSPPKTSVDVSTDVPITPPKSPALPSLLPNIDEKLDTPDTNGIENVQPTTPPSMDLPASLQRRPSTPTPTDSEDAPPKANNEVIDASIVMKEESTEPVEPSLVPPEAEPLQPAPLPLDPDEPSPLVVNEVDEMAVDETPSGASSEPVLLLSPTSSLADSQTLHSSMPVEQLPLVAVEQELSKDESQDAGVDDNAQPSQDEPRPPTPPPQPAPKVKLSLKDFAMRKKKQREEEMAKVQPSSVARDVPSSQSPSRDGDPDGHDRGTPMQVKEDAVHRSTDEHQSVSQLDTAPSMDTDPPETTDTDHDTHAEPVSQFMAQHEHRQIEEPRPLSEESHSGPTVLSPPSSTPPLSPRTPPSHSPPPSTPSRSPSPQTLGGKENAHVHHHPLTLQAKIELVEQVLPKEVQDKTKAPMVIPRTPEPPPNQPFHDINRTPSYPNYSSIPVYPDGYRGPGHYRRPSHEDGEITSTRSEASSPPPGPPAGPKAHNGVNVSYAARTHTPPTGPRNSHVPTTMPPHLTAFRPPPPPPAALASYNPSSLAIAPKRPPTAPRAPRAYAGQSYQPSSYAPSPRSASGQQYIPRGPSADRDRDWDRDRSSWSRPRGRGSTWGR